MNNKSFAPAFLCSFALFCSSAVAQPAPVTNAVGNGDYFLSDRDGNQKVWSRVTWETNLASEIIGKTNSYTELATASSHLVNGVWIDSTDQIEITQTGARATNSQHQVAFLGNINSPGAVDLTLPEGDKHLVSTIIGISYLDTATGQSVLISEIKDSTGELLQSGNQVLYRSAFSDFDADVLYVHKIASFEQLIILRQQPPPPTEWNLSPETTVIQVITEFLNSPSPEITQRLAGGAVDQQLSFGIMQMPHGVAFALGAETNTVPVTKQWLLLDGRTLLVEQVPLKSLQPMLQQLPGPPEGASLKNSPDSVLHVVANRHLLPPRKLARKDTTALKLARADLGRNGLAIDYTTLTSQTNFTFYSPNTYYVSSDVNLSGTTTCEGGATVKFTNSAGINITGTIDCQTGGRFRPAVFTSKDDNSLGETISGSTGNPATSSSGKGGLTINTTGNSLHDLRFSYATSAAALGFSSGQINLTNVQFVNCYYPIDSSSGDENTIILANGLFFSSFYVVHGGEDLVIRGQHLTVNRCDKFGYTLPFSTTGNLYLTNCIVVAATNGWGQFSGIFGSVTTNSTIYFTNDPGDIFSPPVGAASHYLASNSPYRNAGTTNITASLASALRSRTTYPPIVLTNAITADTTLSPQAQRDTDIPDLGVHYDPIDYLANGRTLTNTLVLTNGVVLGTYGASASYGISISGSGKLISQGTPNFLNYIVRYNTVQEQSTTNWSASTIGPSIKIAADAASAQCRFTGWSIPGGTGDHFNTTHDSTPNSFVDCQFTGGKLTFDPGLLNLTNCLLERVYLNLDDSQNDDQWYLFNNLFRGGSLRYQIKGSTPVALAYDNLFDGTTIHQDHGDDFTGTDCNAYVTNKNRLTPNAANDIILTNNPVYLTSFLGNYYYPTNDGMLSLLINAGSRNSTNAGLFQYTTITNLAGGLQIRETNSIVDIGFHRVATDSNGNPIDDDSDGTPSYIEDINGNGSVNSGETDWQSATDLGLKVLITRPRNGSNVP